MRPPRVPMCPPFDEPPLEAPTRAQDAGAFAASRAVVVLRGDAPRTRGGAGDLADLMRLAAGVRPRAPKPSAPLDRASVDALELVRARGPFTPGHVHVAARRADPRAYDVALAAFWSEHDTEGSGPDAAE